MILFFKSKVLVDIFRINCICVACVAIALLVSNLTIWPLLPYFSYFCFTILLFNLYTLGAGEDDYFNYDLEKLLSHFNAGYAGESQQLLVEGCVEGSIVGIDIKDGGAAAAAGGGGVSVVYDESIMGKYHLRNIWLHYILAFCWLKMFFQVLL